MKESSLQDFALFKSGIESETFSSSVNEDQSSQHEFLQKLDQFTHEQLLELINTAKDSQVKSLIIIHLLSQEDFIDSLSGESILDKITKDQGYSPSRLNPLIHALDIRTLHLEFIANLHPEAAVSLLCSFPHFHQLQARHIEALYLRFQNPKLFKYWLSYYSHMPNASFILAHFIALAEADVLTKFNKLNDTQKNLIATRAIERLDLFDLRYPFLYSPCDEQRLILAIQLYLNGHQYKNYSSFIHKFTDAYLSTNQAFSTVALQLFIELLNNKEFQLLNIKISPFINNYIKQGAQAGDMSLFYEDGQLSLNRMLATLNLYSHQKPKPEQGSLFNTFLFGSQLPAQTEKPVSEKNSPINILDYFVTHFAGNVSQLEDLVKQYLGHFVKQGKSEQSSKSIANTCSLLLNESIPPSVRDAVFSGFLTYPELFDQNVCACLLQYDATRTLQSIGFKEGNDSYNQVITFCDLALVELNQELHEATIKKVKQAKSEAELELSFIEDTGVINRLLRRFKRCWVSGWHGFFWPNLPTYVLAAEYQTEVKETIPNQSDSPMLQLSIRQFESHITRTFDNAQAGLELPQHDLDDLIRLLNLYNLQVAPANELDLRTKIETIYQHLLQSSPNNVGIKNWLTRQQHTLLINRFLLLESTLTSKTPAETLVLIKTMDSHLNQFNQLSLELEVELPERKRSADLVIEKSAPHQQSGVFEVATSWISNNIAGFFAFTAPTEPGANTPIYTGSTWEL